MKIDELMNIEEGRSMMDLESKFVNINKKY